MPTGKDTKTVARESGLTRAALLKRAKRMKLEPLIVGTSALWTAAQVRRLTRKGRYER